MIDCYTVWVNQIKTSISSMRLNLQNEDSPFEIMAEPVVDEGSVISILFPNEKLEVE